MSSATAVRPWISSPHGAGFPNRPSIDYFRARLNFSWRSSPSIALRCWPCRAIPAENLPLDEALEKIFMINIDEAAERDREAFIHLIMSEAQQFPEIAALLRTHGVEQSRQMLTDWLSLQQQRGLIAIADAASGARMLMNMIFGAMISHPGKPNDWPNRETRLQHLRQCIAIFVAGCAGASEGPIGFSVISWRDDLSSNHLHALEHNLIRKPLRTFRDHAQAKDQCRHGSKNHTGIFLRPPARI